MSLIREREPSHSHTAAPEAAHEAPAQAHAAALSQAGDAATERMAAKKGPAEPYPPGTELWVHRPLGYHHAAVYIGGGEVVQVKGEPSSALKYVIRGKDTFPVPIVRSTVEEFANGGHVQVGPDGTAHDPQVAIQRALSMVGTTWMYNALTHNCQHFASWCITGRYDSQEADAIENAFKSVLHEPGEIAGAVGDAAGDAVGALKSGLHHIHI